MKYPPSRQHAGRFPSAVARFGVVAAAASESTSAWHPIKAGPLISTTLGRPSPPPRTGRCACRTASVVVRTRSLWALSGCCSTSCVEGSWSLESCGPAMIVAKAPSNSESYLTAASLVGAGGRAFRRKLSCVTADRPMICRLACRFSTWASSRSKAAGSP